MKWALEEILGAGGRLQASMPDFECRPSQLAMAEAVMKAIQQHEHLCVEAGTGTGKTLAYLIPALFAQARVVISTATLHLQEQLLNQDIPLVRQSLFPDLKVACMKGRRNYLCLKRFGELQAQQVVPGMAPQDQCEKIRGWQDQTRTGDRSELEWLADDDPLWHRIDARSETCVGQKCRHFAACWVTRMRQRAFESDLIVVNHALLFANLAIEIDEIGKILPEFSVLVLDEAHEVEDVAADYFGKRISSHQIEDFSRQFQVAFPNASGFRSTLSKLETSAHQFFSAFPVDPGRHSLNFFRGAGVGRTDLREELRQEFRDFYSALQLLYHQLEQERERPPEVEALGRRLDGFLATLEELFELDSPDYVYWFERSGKGLFIHLTPINIARLLREKLFARVDTVVLTSATLATNRNFEFIKRRLGVPDPMEIVVPGEFDFTRQTILYVPRRIAEPRSERYFPRALEEIRKILNLTGGYAFLLFTSFQQMIRVYRALKENDPYPLLCQGEMPKVSLLEVFKSTPGAVLCGTSSFWQGVDVRGDALRAVVIDKLPFQVPTEPIVAARAEQLRREGRDPFTEYMVPAAIMTLKQGLGRLVRSHDDTGILAVLDSRLWSRRYGHQFLKSLPKCSVTDNIEDLENFCRRNVSEHM